MAEPKIGNAALTVTISKEQVAAEAKAAITPAIANASAEASKAITAGVTPNIQAMLAQNNTAAQQSAALVRQSAQETQQVLGQLAQQEAEVGNQAVGSGPKMRGLGAAASAVQGSFGGAAGEGTRLASVLAYGGVAGGAAIAVAKLKELGDSLNHTALSSKELSDLGGKSQADAAKAITAQLQFGDIDAALRVLTTQGASGIGTILNLRDAAIAAGQDTSHFDAILEQFNATQNNTNSTTARGADYLAQFGNEAADAAAEADRLADAASRLEKSTNNQASAAASLLTSQTSVASAENRVRQAKEALANFGTEATGKSIREQRDEAAAVESAAQRIVDAQQSIIDARQKVADAQEKLAEAGVHEALAVNDAQDAVDAAQRKLNASTPEERGPAQHALDDAKQRLTDAKEALDRAKPDAERALAEAVRGVDDAMRSEADAHRQLADAQDRQNESNDKAKKSAGDYQQAVDDVTEAQLALAAATAHQKDLQDELATGTANGPVKQLQNLKDALRGVSGELDPDSDLVKRIVYLLNSLTPYAIEQTFGITGASGGGQPVLRRASGGDVWGGQTFQGAEEGPGMYKAPPGRSTVLNARDTAAALGGGGPREIHHHTYNITVQSVKEPAERAIRRELERFASAPAR